MLSHYRKLLSIRERNKALFARADRTVVALSDEEGYDIVKRTYGEDFVYIALNLNSEVKTVTVATSLEAGTELTDFYGGGVYTVSETGELTLPIPAAADGGTMILGIDRPEQPSFSDGMVAIIAICAALGLAVVVSFTRKKTE
jgi:hypothetical protein